MGEIKGDKSRTAAWSRAEKDYEAYCNHERTCGICRDFNTHRHRCKSGKELFDASVASLEEAQSTND